MIGARTRGYSLVSPEIAGQTLSKSDTIRNPENIPTENHTRTAIEVKASGRGRGRTFGCSPLMEGKRRMYTKSDTVNRARANETNAEFL